MDDGAIGHYNFEGDYLIGGDAVLGDSVRDGVVCHGATNSSREHAATTRAGQLPAKFINFRIQRMPDHSSVSCDNLILQIYFIGVQQIEGQNYASFCNTEINECGCPPPHKERNFIFVGDLNQLNDFIDVFWTCYVSRQPSRCGATIPPVGHAINQGIRYVFCAAYGLQAG